MSSSHATKSAATSTNVLEGTLTSRATPTPGSGTATHKHLRRIVLFALLTVGLFVTVIVSGSTGQLGVPPAEVLGSLLQRIGIDWFPLPPIRWETKPYGRSDFREWRWPHWWELA